MYIKQHNVIFEETASMKISDENDLYFLYSTYITPEEFHRIKSQQGLLVDFNGFGQKVVCLLDMCFNDQHSPTPKYELKINRLIGDNAILAIVETTNFKYLTHLSLNLKAGDDETLKAYMVEKFKNLKTRTDSEISSLGTRISGLENSLSKSTRDFDSLTVEFNTYRENQENVENRNKRMFEEQIHKLKSELDRKSAEYKDGIIRERNMIEEKLNESNSEQTARVSKLKSENDLLRSKSNDLQCKFDSSMKHASDLENRLFSLQSDTAALHSQLKSTELTNQNLSSITSKLESRIELMERDLSAKDQLLIKTQDLLSNEKEQKVKYQDELQDYRRRCEQLEEAAKHEMDEIAKGNEIIRRLQADVKSSTTKAKLRGQVAAEQERLLLSREDELVKLQSSSERCKSDAIELRQKVDQLTSQLESVSKQLTEAHKTIATNENIIGWLNRQVSESQLGQLSHRLKASSTCTPLMMTSSTTNPRFTARSAAVDSPVLSTPMAPSKSPPFLDMRLQPASSLGQYSKSIPSTTSALPCYIPSTLISSVPRMTAVANGVVTSSADPSTLAPSHLQQQHGPTSLTSAYFPSRSCRNLV